MMYLLTIEQKELLVGQYFAPASMFNPVQDVNGNWFISQQEVDQCQNPDFLWVRNLSPTPYLKPQPPENRQQKIDYIMSFLKSELTEIEFRQFIQDVRNYLIDYTYYSDALIYWVETTNNVDWGDFTQIGFKTKSYKGDLVDGLYPRAEYILQILNPTI